MPRLAVKEVFVIYDDTMTVEHGQRLADALPEGVLVLCVHPGTDLAVLDEDEMRKVGWVREARLQELDHPDQDPGERWFRWRDG